VWLRHSLTSVRGSDPQASHFHVPPDSAVQDFSELDELVSICDMDF
jgi:hypothetical protein